MVATLYRGGPVYSPVDPHATALLTVDESIAWVGTDDDCPTRPDVRVDLDGCLLTPAFVDAHLHLTQTGLRQLNLDVSGVTGHDALLEAVAAHAAGLPASATLIAGGLDETRWHLPHLPTGDRLGAAAGGRRVYLANASSHAALCSPALLDDCRDALAGLGPVDGLDGDGWVRRAALDAVWAHVDTQLDEATRTRAQRAALDAAAAAGIGCVHECGGPATSSAADFTAALAAGATDDTPQVVGYWGQLDGVDAARQLGAAGAAGDLYADGALGSSDAHLCEPYLHTGGYGHGLLDADQIGRHVAACTRAGLQAGFHSIGDAATTTVLAGFAAAADQLGLEAIRAGRHRLEHVELLSKPLIAGLVHYGLTASVQPGFDAAWGGEHAMYAQRLGVQRSLEANPLAALAGVGVALAFGSDSPVTPLGGWAAVAAAAGHHNPAQRLSVRTAFAGHTRGGWRAAGDDTTGSLVPGAAAHLAVWDCPAGLADGLPRLGDNAPLPHCRRTVVAGRTIHHDPH